MIEKNMNFPQGYEPYSCVFFWFNSLPLSHRELDDSWGCVWSSYSKCIIQSLSHLLTPVLDLHEMWCVVVISLQWLIQAINQLVNQSVTACKAINQLIWQ